jgi:hypothetical protein
MAVRAMTKVFDSSHFSGAGAPFTHAAARAAPQAGSDEVRRGAARSAWRHRAVLAYPAPVARGEAAARAPGAAGRTPWRI